MEKAKLIYNGKATLGEGPIWIEENNELMWVDIEKTTLNFLNLGTYQNEEFLIGSRVGFAVHKNDSIYYLGTQEGIVEFNRTTTSQQLLHQPPFNFDENIRFNDGKIGPDGAIYAGTMSLSVKEGAGCFYRIDQEGNYKVLIPQTTIANGLGWSPDHKTTYFIDTVLFAVTAWELSHENEIKNKRTVVQIPEEYGAPDGMTVDDEGKLWIAHWGGGKITQWDPKNGKLLRIVTIDAPNVTSCTFIGKKTLAITSACYSMSAKELEEYPNSGGIFIYSYK